MSDIPHTWVDQSFNESMVLFHNVVEIFDGSQFSIFGESFVNGYVSQSPGGNHRILIHIYDSRFLVMSRAHCLTEEPFCPACVPFNTQHEVQDIAL